MKKLRKLSLNAGNTSCCFIPELYDIIVQTEEKNIAKLDNIFLVMGFEGTDMKKVMG